MARLLSPMQQKKLMKAIRLHHASLLVELLGDNAVSKSTLAALKAAGLYRTPKMDIINKAFKYGHASALNQAVLDMRPAEFDHYLTTHKIDLSDQEREAVSLLRQSFKEYVKSLSTTYMNRLNMAVMKADKNLQRTMAQRQQRDMFAEIERRKALASIAKDLAATTPIMLGNASRVVETETNNAFQDGRAREILKAATALGQTDPLVYKKPYMDACDECKKAYLEDDGKTPRLFRMSELVGNGSNIGKSHADRQPVLESFHPHCFPPGTLVTTKRGNVPIEMVTTEDVVLTHRGRWRRVVQLHKNHYSGDLVTVNGLSATPDHPFLTTRGWIPAKALEHGDNLFQAGCDVADIDLNHSPAERFEVLSLARVLTNLSRRAVPGTRLDLDSHPVLTAAEVDVEFTNCKEWSNRQLGAVEKCLECKFGMRKLAALLDGFGSSDEAFQGLLLAADSGMGGSGVSVPVCLCHFGVPDSLGLRHGSSFDAVLVHALAQRLPSDTEKPGHLLHRFLINVVHLVQQVFGKLSSLWHSSLRTVAVSHTDSVPYDGYVYNLSVWGDESYVAGGFVVHNCQCVLHWLSPGFSFDVNGALVYTPKKAAV